MCRAWPQGCSRRHFAPRWAHERRVLKGASGRESLDPGLGRGSEWLCRVGAPMPAAARIALTREAREAGRVAAETAPSETARLWADVLAEVPLFAGVATRHVRKIASLGSVARFDARAPIVNEGDPGEAFYVILSGRAKVQRGRRRATADIGPGAYFGEMALVDGAPRSATIVAETETTCLMLARKPFSKILKDEPAVALALLRTLAARVRELEASTAD